MKLNIITSVVAIAFATCLFSQTKRSIYRGIEFIINEKVVSKTTTIKELRELTGIKPSKAKTNEVYKSTYQIFDGYYFEEADKKLLQVTFVFAAGNAKKLDIKNYAGELFVQGDQLSANTTKADLEKMGNLKLYKNGIFIISNKYVGLLSKEGKLIEFTIDLRS